MATASALVYSHYGDSTTVKARIIPTTMIEAQELIARGCNEEALAILHSLEVPPYLTRRRAQKYHDMGVILLRLGRYNEAADVLRESLGYDPANRVAQQILQRLEQAEKLCATRYDR